MKRHLHKSRAMPGQRGFTIVELLVTMMLAAILFGYAIPSFRVTIANNRLVTQTNELVGALTFARSEAITRNTRVTVCRADDATITTCSGSAGNWGFWIVRNAAGTVLRRSTIQTYNGKLKVTSTLTGDSMYYNSDGLARMGIANAMLTTADTLRVCVNTATKENIRTLTPGMGSRLSTAKTSGVC